MYESVSCIPLPESGRHHFLPQGGEGILFLDELNAEPAMVEASCSTRPGSQAR
jgi:hypothetical protein